MDSVETLHTSIARQLQDAGRASPYAADANEPDPRYRSYGARASDRKRAIRAHAKAIRTLDTDQALRLAGLLIESGYGEQQDVGLFVLARIVDHFGPHNLDIIDGFVRRLHGWSKIDACATSVLPTLLDRHPGAMLDMVTRWNADPDPWVRRASVVVFTRKVAESGRYTDFALDLCDNLVHDEHDHVRKGVGWALKDLMRADKPRVMRYVQSLRAEGVSSVITLYAIKELRGEERRAVLDVAPRRPRPSRGPGETT